MAVFNYLADFSYALRELHLPPHKFVDLGYCSFQKGLFHWYYESNL